MRNVFTMNKQYSPQFEKFLETWIETILNTPWFANWRYNIHYNKFDEGNHHLSISIDLKYLEFTLYVSPIAFKTWKENKEMFVREYLIHEMCHILTENLSWLAEKRYITEKEVEKETEALTETIARMMEYWFVKEGYFK